MEKLVKLSDVEEMVKNKIDNLGVRDYGDHTEVELGELLSSLSSLPTQNEWIPVSERLPEEEGRYLAICNFGADNVEIASYISGKWLFSDSGWAIPNENITKWMPLPNN